MKHMNKSDEQIAPDCARTVVCINKSGTIENIDKRCPSRIDHMLT